MPSGAKKRKAARKKKEREAAHIKSNGSTTTNSQGSQDEQGSDRGEDDFPPSEEQNNHDDHSNGRNGDLEKMDGVQIDVEAQKRAEVEDNGAVEVERELKSEENSDKKVVDLNGVERSKESYDGYKSDSVTNISEKNSEEKAICYFDKLVDPSPPELHQQPTEDELVDKDINFSGGTVSIIDEIPPDVSASEETISTAEVAAVDNCSVSDVIGSDTKDEKKISSPEETSNPSVTLTVLRKEKDDEALFLPEDNNKSSGGTMEHEAEKLEGKTLPVSSIPVTRACNGAERAVDSETPECSENQPLVASAPRVVQNTPWWSCCGILDVFSSNR